MNATTDWTSALAILGAGLALGALFIFVFNKRRTRTLGDEHELARKDLEAKRDALIAQLRDPSTTADERARLENETAEVLRKLDAGRASARPVPAERRAEARPASGMNPSTKGFLWGAGSCAALAALFYFVMQAAEPRQEGGTVTGNLPAMQQQAPPQQAANPMLQQLEGAVQRDPENLQLRNDLAQAYLEQENLMAVFEQTKFVLDRQPEDSRALTYAALVRMAMGESDQARSMLQRAAKSNPKNLDSWVGLAWMHAQRNEMKEAEAMIAEAAKQSPGDKARLEDVLRQMKQAASAPPIDTASGELPAGHPPVDGAPAAPTQVAGPVSGPSVNVTLELDPAARSKTGILFVIARNPAGGPPAAVKRLQGVTFPLTITLSSADSMMGQPLPARFRLEARLDSDGDAATKPPTDPAGMVNDVVPGANVTLALK
ncbi:MAG TPA: tetratricopeptide repeat protein [Thermoanaerobaculia bacterium]|nr:tetratricopeptide repeat protein [Thermoanaerobaculia bacterium]